MPEDRNIAVIGGGAAGCCAAWILKETEFQVQLFEKEPWLGGRTHTWRQDDYVINTGAGFFTNFYPLLWELMAELGLSRQMLNHDKETVLSDGKQRYPFHVASMGSFFRLPWLSLREKLRVISMTVGLLLRKTQFDLVDPRRLARFDNQSIADFARQRLGDNVYHHLIRTAIEPYWYFSCEDASAAMLMALQTEAPGAQFYSLRTGMDQVTTELAKEIPKHLQDGVTGIRRTSGGQFELTTESGIQDTLFDGIVIATQAHQALQLVTGMPDDLVTESQRNFLASQQYAANINVWYRTGELDAEDCGFQLSPVGREWHGIAAWTDLGSVNQADLPPEERVAGAYLLHDFSLQLLNEPDNVVADRVWQAVRKFQPTLPARHPEVVKINRRRYAIPIPEVGRYKLAADFQSNQQAPVVFAGDYLATATIEGALQTGRIAAECFLD